MAPTRAHRGDAHRSPVIETSSTRALFTVFYNHRMLTRSRRVIAHTRTQRAPIAHRSSARPTFVDALFLSNDDSSPRRRPRDSDRVFTRPARSNPSHSHSHSHSHSRRVVARVRVARRSSRTRDRRSERVGATTTTRDDDARRRATTTTTTTDVKIEIQKV